MQLQPRISFSCHPEVITGKVFIIVTYEGLWKIWTQFNHLQKLLLEEHLEVSRLRAQVRATVRPETGP